MSSSLGKQSPEKPWRVEEGNTKLLKLLILGQPSSLPIVVSFRGLNADLDIQRNLSGRTGAEDLKALLLQRGSPAIGPPGFTEAKTPTPSSLSSRHQGSLPGLRALRNSQSRRCHPFFGLTYTKVITEEGNPEPDQVTAFGELSTAAMVPPQAGTPW